VNGIKYHVIITERARNAEETNATTKPLIPRSANKSDTFPTINTLIRRTRRRTITLPLKQESGTTISPSLSAPRLQ
jgi:hypothetical protein